MSEVLVWIVGSFGAVVLFCGVFFLYVLIRYGSDIYRVFETKPLFLVSQNAAQSREDEVHFETQSGRKLVGSYYPHCADEPRRGVVVFCHEFSANRWLFEPYLGFLLEEGFDIFSFDFCNHGQSDSISSYSPLQWVTEYEAEDVRAAAAYLKGRPDADPNGIAVFGVSKGGGAAIAAAAQEPYITTIITDGAFPTHGTVTQYETEWVGIFVRRKFLYTRLPFKFWAMLTDLVIWRMSRKHRSKYIRLEHAIRQLGDRPLFMIHGGRDNYIKPIIAERFFALASEPKEFWCVEGAKHNGCLEIDPEEYRTRVFDFLKSYFPVPAEPEPAAEKIPTEPAKST